MALDFPASPTVGQTFTAPSGVIWSWDGAKWANGTQASAYAPVASPTFTGDPQAPTPSPGDSDTSIATTAFVQAAVATALHDTGRNLIHNPLFNVAQRGAGGWGTQGYTVDRWKLQLGLDTSSIGWTAIALGSLSGDEQANLVIYCSVVGNAGTASYTLLNQPIENVLRLSGKTVTVSFYATPSAGTPKIGVSLDQVFGTGGSPSAAVFNAGQSVTLVPGWTRYSLTFTVPSATGKTLGTNNDSFTSLNFWFSSGTTQATRAGNVGVQTGVTIYLWGVQLEIGSIATPLEKPDPRYDLSNCQRFYQSISGWQIAAATFAAGATSSAALVFPPMRATPTVALTNVTGGGGASAPAVTAVSPSVCTSYFTLGANSTGWIQANVALSADL